MDRLDRLNIDVEGVEDEMEKKITNGRKVRDNDFILTIYRHPLIEIIVKANTDDLNRRWSNTGERGLQQATIDRVDAFVVELPVVAQTVLAEKTVMVTSCIYQSEVTFANVRNE